MAKATLFKKLDSNEASCLARMLSSIRNRANQAGITSQYPYGYPLFEMAAEFDSLYWEVISQYYKTSAAEIDKFISERVR